MLNFLQQEPYFFQFKIRKNSLKINYDTYIVFYFLFPKIYNCVGYTFHLLHENQCICYFKDFCKQSLKNNKKYNKHGNTFLNILTSPV